MIIDLEALGNRVEEFDVSFSPAELDLPEDELVPVSDAHLSGTLKALDDGFEVSGRVMLSGKASCARCLNEVAIEIDTEFVAGFVREPDADGAAELELTPDELDRSFLTEDRIDLREVAREQILLALPDRAFCRTDCQGLCPICGADRNLIDCSCAESGTDPRWDALRNLK